ncbi:hypothetical protein FY136_28865 (plasmid) [Agrobacterium tumefaciens]|uniref:hypothetical protein n=1 Tax=Agrobacterium tumefaciens TaxID=358 RepID=UPI0021D09819|nr:hypothetical protein [Agrobacterium tumefaciens]UXT53276.1 hypothetical protein FY136_28865 [Agrobacterium tumefaciens]
MSFMTSKDPAMSATLELAALFTALITPFEDAMTAPLRPLPERPSYSVAEVQAYRQEINQQRQRHNEAAKAAVVQARATFDKLKDMLADAIAQNIVLRQQLDQASKLLEEREAAIAHREGEIELLLDLQDAVRERLAAGHPDPMGVVQERIAAS